jgi:hypothetical protein
MNDVQHIEQSVFDQITADAARALYYSDNHEFFKATDDMVRVFIVHTSTMDLIKRVLRAQSLKFDTLLDPLGGLKLFGISVIESPYGPIGWPLIYLDKRQAETLPYRTAG